MVLDKNTDTSTPARPEAELLASDTPPTTVPAGSRGTALPTRVGANKSKKRPSRESPARLTKPPTREGLSKQQELKITGRLLEGDRPIAISFAGLKERIRAFSNRLPLQFWRTFHEESKTHSSYTNTENQPKHREAEGLKIRSYNAFQAIGVPDLRTDLTLNRLDRHLSWGTVKKPSSWFSVFNLLHWAIRRAGFHTDISAKIGHRISIAGISAKGLVAATVHGQYETTYEVITSYGRGRHKEVTEVYIEVHDVAIPVWIRDSAVPEDRSAITRRQFETSGADLWVSIMELRRSDLRKVSNETGLWDQILQKGHDYEWLCLGSIRKEHITCVMPWDGKVLHPEDKSRIVWSKSSPEKYIFDWTLRQWRLDPKLYALAVFRDRKAELKRTAKYQARRLAKAEGRKIRKLAVQKGIKPRIQKTEQTPKHKRKHRLDEYGNDIGGRQSKIMRTNADVWDLMITAQKKECQCKDLRHTRAGSAQL